MNESIESFTSLHLPEGVLLLVEDDNEIAAMSVVHKLSDDTGEIKRARVSKMLRSILRVRYLLIGGSTGYS